MAADDLKKTTRDELESALKKASTVVAAYGSVLEQVTEPGFCCILNRTYPLPRQK
jgi:hypothetical protein